MALWRDEFPRVRASVNVLISGGVGVGVVFFFYIEFGFLLVVGVGTCLEVLRGRAAALPVGESKVSRERAKE